MRLGDKAYGTLRSLAGRGKERTAAGRRNGYDMNSERMRCAFGKNGMGTLEGTRCAFSRNGIRFQEEYDKERKEMLRWRERSVSCLRG